MNREVRAIFLSLLFHSLIVICLVEWNSESYTKVLPSKDLYFDVIYNKTKSKGSVNDELSKKIKPSSKKNNIEVKETKQSHLLVDRPNVQAASLFKIYPQYPQLSRKKGEQGSVVLELLLKRNGEVISYEVTKSSSFHRLDQAAIESIKNTRLELTTVTLNKNELIKKRVRFKFKLNKDE